jgi:hypothetical protein
MLGSNFYYNSLQLVAFQCHVHGAIWVNKIKQQNFTSKLNCLIADVLSIMYIVMSFNKRSVIKVIAFKEKWLKIEGKQTKK